MMFAADRNTIFSQLFEGPSGRIGSSRPGNGECRLSKCPVISIVEDDAAVRGGPTGCFRTAIFQHSSVEAAAAFRRGTLDSSSRDLPALIGREPQTLRDALASLPKPSSK